jgi:DNA-binding response OmpR family regulator
MTENPPVPPAGGPAAPRVLVIEDDQTVRAMLAAWLHSERCEYTIAVDAASAQAPLASQDFDLLLCDINLPDADGPDIVESIEGRNRGVPVIFLTGQPTLETAIRSVQLRVVAYLIKPPNLDELRRLVFRAVAAHRERRAISASRRRLKDWDVQLAQLEQALDLPDRAPTAVEHMRLTLHQLGALLQDLDRSITAVSGEPPGQDALAQLDFVTSLRRTVQVLERTRLNFKSKALGDLRRDLEGVLQRLDQP